MTDDKKQLCHLCGNHCSTDNLCCKKGIRYFNHPLDEERVGNNMIDNSENSMDNNNQKENIERHHHLGGQECHQGDNHHSEKCGRYGRHRGSGRFSYENSKEDDLLSLLDRSSHILHYKKGGKRGQGKVLKILAKHQEINQKELQEILGIESGSMSELVIKLEHKGLITRTKDETDKRMTKLMITELGLEVSKELESRDSEDNKLLYGSLSEQEQEELKVLLQKLLQGWEENNELLRENGHSCLGKGEHNHTNRDAHQHNGGRRRGMHQ